MWNMKLKISLETTPKHFKRLSVRQHMPSSKGTPELVNRHEIAEVFFYSTWLCKIRFDPTQNISLSVDLLQKEILLPRTLNGVHKLQ